MQNSHTLAAARTGAGSLNAGSQAPQQINDKPVVEQAVIHAHESIMRLEEVLSQLHSRTVGVCRPPMNIAEGIQTESPSTGGSPHVQSIDAIAVRINNLTDNLRDLLNRAEF